MSRARQTTVLAMGLSLMGIAAAETPGANTRTVLSSSAQQVEGREVTTYLATVESSDGQRPGGVVTLLDGDRPVASAAVNAQGKAELRQDSLSSGEHTLYAVYGGDSLRAGSKSEGLAVHSDASSEPDFTFAISPNSMTLKAGTSGTTTATITPLNGFTGFLSLSCSGLPIDEITCTFTPANVQVSSSASVTADLGVVTLASGGKASPSVISRVQGSKSPLMLAILLPGVVGLGLIGRKRKALGGGLLLVIVGLATVAGTSSCAARYRYLNHGPHDDGTPTGNYTLTVTAQTSNGVTATEHSTTLAVTVD